MNVKEILENRDRGVVTVAPETSIENAAQIMTNENIGAVIILDRSGAMAGILSERDILAAVGAEGSQVDQVKVGDLMTARVVTCSPEDTIIQVILKFDALGIRHLVAVDDGEMVGVLSMRDVLEAFSRLILEKKIFGQRKFATEFAAALAAA